MDIWCITLLGTWKGREIMAGSRRVRIPRKARKARSGKYKFSDKVHPIEGIVSFGMGILALILVVNSIILSEKAQGQGGMLIGFIGVLAMLDSLIGFILALCSMRKREIHYRFPIMGGVMNGVITIALLILYVMGAAMV